MQPIFSFYLFICLGWDREKYLNEAVPKKWNKKRNEDSFMRWINHNIATVSDCRDVTIKKLIENPNHGLKSRDIVSFVYNSLLFNFFLFPDKFT